MKRLVYGVLLVAASCALMAGSASRPAVALESSPIVFADCVVPATDCCNPACKAIITGCCVNNSCGLPVLPVVYSKNGGAISASCSAMQPPPSTPKRQSPRPPATSTRPNG